MKLGHSFANLVQVTPSADGRDSKLFWVNTTYTAGSFVSPRLERNKSYIVTITNGLPYIGCSVSGTSGLAAGNVRAVIVPTAGQFRVMATDFGAYGSMYVHYHLPAGATAGATITIHEEQMNRAPLPFLPILDPSAPGHYQGVQLIGTGFSEASNAYPLIPGRKYMVVTGAGTIRLAFSNRGGLTAPAVPTTNYVVLNSFADFTFQAFDAGDYGATHVYATGNAAAGAWSATILMMDG